MRVAIDELDFTDGVFHLKRLFTGTSIEVWPDGAPREEHDFVDGFAHGWHREWTSQGTLIKEQFISSGVVHGLSRTWHDNGQLASLSHYQFGIRLTTSSWDDAGVRAPDYQIDLASDQHRRWQQSVNRARSRALRSKNRDE